MKFTDSTILAYIAGFLDGDGSIFSQIVKTKSSKENPFKIRTSIAFYQKTTNVIILETLKGILKSGYIRYRKTDVSDYTIVESPEVKRILNLLFPYVRLKTEHIKLALEIISQTEKEQTINEFIETCKLVDRFEKLNYSKKRKIKASTVEDYFKSKFFTPVETEAKAESLVTFDESFVKRFQG